MTVIFIYGADDEICRWVCDVSATIPGIGDSVQLPGSATEWAVKGRWMCLDPSTDDVAEITWFVDLQHRGDD